jgi:uncharacterized spore protein YtfJ
VPEEPQPAHPSAPTPERLAELLQSHASAATIFGAPVEQDGVIVVPAARAMYGFGGGSGHQGAEGGAGGGLMIRPDGYIEIRGGRARYRRIGPSVSGLLVPTLMAAFVYLALRRRL